MSEIRATTISDLAGTGPATLTKQSAAKAWVNFNGQGTIAARDSFNVASLTDNGTGNYTVNIASAFASADRQCGTACAQSGGTTSIQMQLGDGVSLPTATTQRLLGLNAAGTAFADLAYMHCGMNGDLA